MVLCSKLSTIYTSALLQFKGWNMACKRCKHSVHICKACDVCLQVQQFGLLLALLVAVNFALAVTWLPVFVICWDKCSSCCTAWSILVNLALGLLPAAPATQHHAGLSGQAREDQQPVHLQATKAGITSESVGHDQSAALCVAQSCSKVVYASESEQLDDDTPRTTHSISKTTPLTHWKPQTDLTASRVSATQRSGQLPGNSVSFVAWVHRLCSWERMFGLLLVARYALLAMLAAAAACGGVFAAKLQPADSLPKLFDNSHNVQRFLDMWSSNFTESSLFACPTCLAMSASQQFASSGGRDSGESGLGESVNSTDELSAMAAMLQSGVGANMTAASQIAAAAAAQQAIRNNSTPEQVLGIAAYAAATAAPPGSAEANVSNIDPLKFMPVDQNALEAKRVDRNTIEVSAVWGVEALTLNAEDADKDASLTFDTSFNLADASTQRAVLRQVCLHVALRCST